MIEYIKNTDCNCSLEVFKIRVETLWGAVLNENFVFDFKNTLEVCAYNELDSQYGQWSWAMQHEILKWEQTTSNEINSCDCQSQDIINFKKNALKKLKKSLLLFALSSARK